MIVILESEAQQKERWRQAYLRALEKYKQETRAFEQRNGKLMFAAVTAVESTYIRSLVRICRARMPENRSYQKKKKI